MSAVHKRAAEAQIQVSELMMPDQANIFGKVFGGEVVALIDKAAYVAAARHAQMMCVTVSFDRVDFHTPVNVGELVHIKAHVDFVGHSSLGVGVEVYSENVQTGEMRHTNSSYVTMVAIKDGKPAEVPRLICETDDEKRRFLVGRYRHEWRSNHHERLGALRKMLESAGTAQLDEMIASDKLPAIHKTTT